MKNSDKDFDTINAMLDTPAQDAREIGDAQQIDDALFALRRRVGFKPHKPTPAGRKSATDPLVTSTVVLARQTSYPATFLGVTTYTWKKPKVSSSSYYELYVKADATSGWKIAAYGDVPSAVKPVVDTDGYVDAPPVTAPAHLRQAVVAMRQAVALGDPPANWGKSKSLTAFAKTEHARYLYWGNKGDRFATEDFEAGPVAPACAPIGGGRMVCFSGMSMTRNYRGGNSWVSFEAKTPSDLQYTGGLKAGKYSTATVLFRAMFIVELSTAGTGPLRFLGVSEDMPQKGSGVRYR